jgi:hypothetical protein
MYTKINFKSKKDIKEAIASWKKAIEEGDPNPNRLAVRCYAPGLGDVPENGYIALEGPHFPKPHRWYGEGIMENGILVFIK